MKYRNKVPCQKEKLQEIRSFVKDVLNKHGLSELDISTIVLAIDEVCANLIIHAHHCNPKHTIEIEINVKESNQIVFKIIDNTKIFDISTYEEPKIEDIIKRQRKGGIGLILVKRIMDDIKVYSENNKHICRLTKNVSLTDQS